MSTQEHFRAQYRRLRPGWRESLVLYREAVSRHVGPGDRVLDLGCGHADWLAPEVAGVGFIAGADPDLDALRRNRLLSNRVAAVGERLPFRGGVFDVVVSAWVFEHLEDPRAAICELRRVLRPGGRLVFLTPNAWNYNVWLIRLVPNRLHDLFTRRLYRRQDRDTYPVHYRLNSARRIEAVMLTAGFRCLEFHLNGDPTYVGLNRPLFAVARALERILDLRPLQPARVHMIGVYQLAGG
jgi:SAM-dependent methyltransferase